MTLHDLIKNRLVPLSPLPTKESPKGKPDAAVKAVLFDIYGTLLISASGEIGEPGNGEERHKEIEQLLNRWGVQRPPQKLKDDLTAAILRRHQQLRAEGIDYPEIEIQSIWQSILNWRDMEQVRRFALEYELTINPVWPMPHLWHLLKTLASIKIRMGIISNAQFYTPIILEALADVPLERLGFDPDLIFFSYRYQRAKPSLYLFEKALGRLEQKGIDANHVIYMGNDMRNDILPAQRVGFQTVLFAGDARSLRHRPENPDCRKRSADIIVTDLLQLPDMMMI